MKTTIAVLFLLTHFCYTQPIDITRVLSDYIGTWETAYEVTEGIKPGTAKEILTIDGAAKNMYLHIKLTGWMAGDSVKFNWVEESFITYDFSSRTLEGFYINSNGSGSAENLKGKWDEESGSIEVEGESKNDKETVLWEVKGGKLYKKIDWTSKESGKKGKITRVFIKSN